MKLVIGTAQFGLNYGVSNKSGKVNLEECQKIIKFAHQIGIDTIDTAIAYGDAHEILSQIGTNNFKIISKLPDLSEKNQVSTITELFYSSLRSLNRKSIYAFMFHSAQDLLSKNSLNFYNELNSIKKYGLLEKIGVSVYNPSDLKVILNYFDIDIIQVPLNIFDTRFLEIINSNNFKVKNIEVHIRSVFLQGLLLMCAEDIPNSFFKWKLHFQKWETFNSKNNISKLESAIQFVKRINSVDKIVVGVESLSQLQQIYEAYNSTKRITFNAHLTLDDEQLINPKNWSR